MAAASQTPQAGRSRTGAKEKFLTRRKQCQCSWQRVPQKEPWQALRLCLTLSLLEPP